MGQVVYGKLRVSYNDYEELASKLANYLKIEKLPVDYCVAKAHIRQQAELSSRTKRAEREGKEVKERAYTEL